jgi:membrane-associated protease RseP (regulator of RpoE activity)
MKKLFSPRDKPWLNLFLFFGTCVTTFSCFRFFFEGGIAGSAWFALCALLILGAHEMGHYVMARAHGVDSSLPYFIPLPLAFGTLGAVIRIRSRIPTRNALVDIGAAGPLAGLLVAIPLLFVGLGLSRVVDAPAVHTDVSLIGLVQLIRDLIEGREVADPTATVFGDNLLTWLAQRWTFGPLPAGKDVVVHPIYTAAWFGLLVTMLNLMPIGQLDGGHLTHAWLGPWAIPLGKALAVVMAVMAVFFSFSWVVWLLVTSKVIGFRHPEVGAPELPLSRGRKVVCAVCFVLFVLTVMPAPLSSA